MFIYIYIYSIVNTCFSPSANQHFIIYNYPRDHVTLLPAAVIPPVVIATAAQEQLDTLHVAAHREQGQSTVTAITVFDYVFPI